MDEEERTTAVGMYLEGRVAYIKGEERRRQAGLYKRRRRRKVGQSRLEEDEKER